LSIPKREDREMNGKGKEMYLMAGLNNISQDKLVKLLFSSYQARLESLRKKGALPEKANIHDLKWLILLFLHDRGYLSDPASARLSEEDGQTALRIIDLILDTDRLRQYQKNLLQRLHRKRMSSDMKLRMIQLVEDIESQIDNNIDFVVTFSKHIQVHKSRETEVVWGSFVQNRTLERMLSRGTELTARQRSVPRVT
jgi:hypothetical protein